MMEESNKVSTILQCFVDTNLELNENFPYAGTSAPNVFFTEKFRTAPENTSIKIDISLSVPSDEGRESVTVVFIPGTASLEDVDIDLPKTLTWAKGEQIKSVFVEIKKDFELEDGRKESFQLVLVGVLNCQPKENESTTTVFIEDKTVFNRVSFLETEESSLLTNGLTQYLSYSYDTDNPVTLRVGLDNPSEAGVERLDIKLYRLNTPNFDGRFAGVITSIPVQFNIGEQTKDIVIENIAESILNSSPILVAAIEGTIKVVLDVSAGAFQNALMYVEDNSLSINRRWTSINFGCFYRQKGPTTTGYVQLRSPVSSEIPQTLDSIQNSWAIKYGNVYIDNDNNEENGFPEANYESYPTYRFGPSVDDSLDDISLKVTNDGEFDILWDNVIIEPGETFEISVSTPDFEILLPSNSQLIEAGETIPQTGEAAIERLYSQSLYSMSLKYNNAGYSNPDGDSIYSHGFTLQNGNDGQIELGSFDLTNYGNQFESQLNKDYLTGYYLSASTRYNGSVCANEFSAFENIYDIRILGAILLDDTGPITAYGGFEFIKFDEFNPVCGENNNSYTSPLWSGIPFEIATPIDNSINNDTDDTDDTLAVDESDESSINIER